MTPDFGWDYPPGVTGREPEIAGDPEWHDANGDLIEVGSRVKHLGVTDGVTTATVTDLLPSDDVDDDGRVVSNYVEVEFDGGERENVYAVWQGDVYTGHFLCEELEVVA